MHWVSGKQRGSSESPASGLGVELRAHAVPGRPLSCTRERVCKAARAAGAQPSTQAALGLRGLQSRPKVRPGPRPRPPAAFRGDSGVDTTGVRPPWGARALGRIWAGAAGAEL